jgi:hypothetical protein
MATLLLSFMGLSFSIEGSDARGRKPLVRLSNMAGRGTDPMPLIL